ncbi:MAG: tetratricopeptide repeat protein [Myxococcota bacterium]
MTWYTTFNEVRAQLDRVATQTDAVDAYLGRAIYAILQKEELPEDFRAPEHRDPLYRLAWWLFVRAPMLRTSYLMLSPMTLDLVLDGSRTIDEIFDDLATLEQAAEEGIEEDVEYPGAARLRELFTDHFLPPERILELSGDDLRYHVDTPLDRVGERREEFTELTQEIMSSFMNEFDEAARANAFRSVGDADSEVQDDRPELEGAAAYVERAERSYDLGDLDLALRDFERAIELDSGSVEAWTGRGIIEAAGGLVGEALESFTRALSLDPADLGARINRGLAFMANLSFDAAAQDFTLALEQDDGLLEVWINRSNARVTLGDLDGAMADAEAAVELAPESSVPWIQRAMLRRQAGDVHGARRDYSMAIEKHAEDGDAWAGRGFLNLEAGEVRAAERDFSQAITRQPDRGVLYYNRGNARGMLEDFEGALEDYSMALELDPEDLDAMVNRGVAYLKLDDLKHALADWDNAIQLDPNHHAAYHKRGSVLWMSEEYTYAKADLERALEFAPADWHMRELVTQQIAEVDAAMKRRDKETNGVGG